MKRAECYKCKSPRPKDGGLAPPLPTSGTTMNGMVKSYNRKGFGFIMCLNGGPGCQDIYYSRENLHISLQTRDIPGEHVTFEIQRFHDGKLVAKNIRPVGESADIFRAAPSQPPPTHKPVVAKGPRGEEEDRSRDWICDKCHERNFVKRFECFKCKTPKKPDVDESGPAPRRTFSPHAGARAIREALAGKAQGSRSRSRKKSSASSSSSSSRRKKSKRKKKGKKNKRKRSSSSSSSKSSRSSKSNAKEDEKDIAEIPESAAPKNPEVEKAKAENLEKLVKLQSIEPKEQRMRAYRELLRQWHPDKNPDKVVVATAVFQFLQKAKPMIDPPTQ